MTRARLGASARGVARVPPAAPTPAHAYYQEVAEDGVVFPQEDILNFINYFILTDTAGVSTNVNLDIPAIIAALYYQTVQQDAVSLTQQPRLNFVQAGWTVTNNGGNTSTDVAVDAQLANVVYIDTTFAGSPSTGTLIKPFPTLASALVLIAATPTHSWYIEGQHQGVTENPTIPAINSNGNVLCHDLTITGNVTIASNGRFYFSDNAIIGNISGTPAGGQSIFLNLSQAVVSGTVTLTGAGTAQLYVDGVDSVGAATGTIVTQIIGNIAVQSYISASQALISGTVSTGTADWTQCRFGGAHTYSGVTASFVSCHTMPPSITFSGSAGTVYLDAMSYYWFQQAGTTVTNGSVILMSPAVALPGTTQKPAGAEFLTTGTAPALTTRDGTSFPVSFLAYDDTNDSAAFWHEDAVNYQGGNVLVTIQWNSESATSGNVVWGVSLAAVTPGDAGSYEAKALAAEITATSACLATTAKRLTSVTLTITGASLDSLARNDNVTIRIRRLGSNGSDTMAGNANFELAQIAW